MFLRIFMFGEYFYMYQSTCLSWTYFFNFKKVNGQGQKLMPVNSQFFFFCGTRHSDSQKYPFCNDFV